MWKNLKLIHLWRNFSFLHMFHVQKFEISPHDRFFLHGHRPCVRDKYEVWSRHISFIPWTHWAMPNAQCPVCMHWWNHTLSMVERLGGKEALMGFRWHDGSIQGDGHWSKVHPCSKRYISWILLGKDFKLSSVADCLSHDSFRVCRKIWNKY